MLCAAPEQLVGGHCTLAADIYRCGRHFATDVPLLLLCTSCWLLKLSRRSCWWCPS